MKIKDLAAELKLTGREVLEKAKGMGVEVSKVGDELSEIDATSIKNTFLRANAKAETKVARRSSAKKVEAEQKNEEPKVTVKAASIKMPEKKKAPARKSTVADSNVAASKKSTSKATESKETATKTSSAKPVISKAMLEERIAKEKAEAEAKKEELEIKAEKAGAIIEEKAAEATEKVAKKLVEASEKVAEVSEKVTDKVATEAGKLADEAKKAEKEAKKAVTAAKAKEKALEVEKEASAKSEKKAEAAPPKKKEEKSRTNIKVVRKAEDVRRDEKEAAERRRNAARTSEKSPRRSSDRPARTSDRPARSSDRPARTSDRPVSSRNNNAPRTDRQQSTPSANKTSNYGKKGKERDRDKTRDRFSKLERGAKGQNRPVPKSLEKEEKKKRHQNRPKVEEVVVPEVELEVGTVLINCPITVAGFVEQTKTTLSQAIMTLMKMGIMANQNQNLDEDTVRLLADEMGIKIAIGAVDENKEYLEEEGIETFEDKEEDLKPRAPIITVMGHVDHGKTSLLDAIRNTNVTAGESGGITQHIGASEVEINGQKIVFLDTPGHEAFTAMRARGAHATDIAVLVVAADDSVKPQTIESISHAKSAGVPIIVAINKMDKPGANPDVVKKDLAEQNILVEDWGGDVICVPVSAKTGEGIKTLLEMILLQAEVLELKANPDRLAVGTVLEARLDKAKGPIASLLVLNGTLKSDMSVVAGTCSGKIRLMTNEKGEKLKKTGPATAVEILGLSDVPVAGDVFNAVKKSSQAKEIAYNRQVKVRQEVLARNSSTTLEELFSHIQEGEVKELNLIIKADVQGSVGAIVSSLEKLSNEEVKVSIVHTGVGAINESDVMLAGTSGAIIIGFNVRPSVAVTGMADRDGIQIRTYTVIYNIIDDVENAMKGMLDPEYKEVVLGTVEIRDTFKVPNIGIIGGAYVTDGKVVRNESIRLVRDGIVIHEGKISSLKRFKDDAKEVAQGYECGIGIENYNDIKVGDVIECFTMEEIARN